MVTGIVPSKQSHLEVMAGHVPARSKVTSRAKKFARFIQNEGISQESYFLPFLVPLGSELAQGGPLVRMMEASETGRRCLTLLVSVVYEGRALPLAWLTVRGHQGHLAEATHMELLHQVAPLIPAAREVIFLGDGEFDGGQLQPAITQAGWDSVCRTAKNRPINDDGECFALDELQLSPGDCLDMPAVAFGQEAYRPVTVMAWWQEGYLDPL